MLVCEQHGGWGKVMESGLVGDFCKHITVSVMEKPLENFSRALN